MEQSSEGWDKRKQDLKDAIDTNDDHVDALNDLKAIQIMVLTMYQREAARLSRVRGESDPRVKGLHESVERSLDLVESLDIEAEIAAIRVPETPEGGALVHGRVAEITTNRGIAGLTVFGEDEKGVALRTFGSADTDASGYFNIPVDDEALKALQAKDIYLTIRVSGGVIHRERKPVQLEPDAQRIVNIDIAKNSLNQTLKSESGDKSPLSGKEAPPE